MNKTPNSQHAGAILELRSFTEADRLPCQRIAAHAALSSYGSRLPEFRDRFVEGHPLEPADERIVAVWNGGVAGFLDLIGRHVSNLFVDPRHQGRGIGTALMAEAERRVTGDLTLSVFTVNPEARRLYERLGFLVECTRMVAFANSKAEVWVMRKPRPAGEVPMIIRTATPDDQPALHNLLTQTWLTTWAPRVAAASVERFKREDPVARYLAGHLPLMMIADDKGRVLGMTHLVGNRIAAVHVLADAQGRGVGSRLMDYSEAHGGRILEVSAFNTHAIRFYEKRGWHPIRRYADDEFGTTLETIEMGLAERP